MGHLALRHQMHAALWTAPRVILTNLGVHGAGVDRAARPRLCGAWCVCRHRHRRVHGMAAMGMRVPMGHLALGHQMHVALWTAPRVILTNLRVHGAGVNNGCVRLHGGWLLTRFHDEPCHGGKVKADGAHPPSGMHRVRNEQNVMWWSASCGWRL